MSNSERLADIITSKLIERGLISENNTDFKNKLSSGNLKDVDWKLLLENVTPKSENSQGAINEAQEVDETE